MIKRRRCFTSRSDCTLRVHLPYGYNVQLAVHLLNSDDSTPFDSSQSSSEVILSEEWLLQSGRCPVAVEAEDINGRKATCLREGHPKATFASATNVLDFHIILLQTAIQGELDH